MPQAAYGPYDANGYLGQSRPFASKCAGPYNLDFKHPDKYQFEKPFRRVRCVAHTNLPRAKAAPQVPDKYQFENHDKTNHKRTERTMDHL